MAILHRGCAVQRSMSCLVVIVAIGLAAGAARATSTFAGLGFLPGEEGSWAAAISDDGSTVVGYAVRSADFQAFRWTAEGGMVQLGPGFAIDVSANGSVVVGAYEGGSRPDEAFRWTAASGVVLLGSLPDHQASIANAVSADGSVVVGGASNPQDAFIWTASAGMLALGGLGVEQLGFISRADAISADGSVVVGTVASPSGGLEAFRWTTGTGIVPIGGTLALATSADGSVVVGQTGNAEAYRWTAATGRVSLGPDTGIATDVSADGSIVVGEGDDGAFVWDSAHGVRSVQQLLEQTYGLDLSGWELVSARGISADGRAIVGYGWNPEGAIEGWIAVIPEPSTAVLVGLGLVALAARRRVDRRS